MSPFPLEIYRLSTQVVYIILAYLGSVLIIK